MVYNTPSKPISSDNNPPSVPRPIDKLVATKLASLKENFVNKILETFTPKTYNKKDYRILAVKLREELNDTQLILKKDEKNEAIRNIFFKKISKLGDAEFIFYLKKNTQLLDKKTENILSPELAKLRQAKEEIKNKTDLTTEKKEKKLETIKLAIRIEKAQLGKKLGIKFKANKGATGTVLVKNLKGKYIGVFKPTHEFTPLKARLLNSIKRIFGGQLYYLSHKTDAQAKAEAAAYLLDRHFKFNLSPASDFVENLGGKKGTFQSFLAGFTEAKDIIPDRTRGAKLHLPRTEEEIKDFEYKFTLTDFQKMAIFDYLIGNLDRHEENWGVVEIKTKTGIFEELKVIDSANAFLLKNPESSDKVKNQYKWKSLNLAKEPLTEETKKFINENLKDENLATFLNEIYTKFPKFLHLDMELELINRLHVIQNFAETGKSLAELGTIISDTDIEQHRKKKNWQNPSK